MRVDWHTFHENGQTVEAQFFAPDVQSHQLILFCPGFPGRGGTMFEQRHAAALVEHGYTVCVIKHAGTRIDGPDAPFMINNGARLMKARKNKETHLGGGPSTMKAWLNEPGIVLENLHGAFKDIHVFGNSFGAVSALEMLIKPGAPIENIKTLVFYAGAQGVDENPLTGIMRVWNPVILATPAIWEKITLDQPMSISETMRASYAHIAEKAGSIPARINIKYLVVKQDEILKLADTESFKTKIMGGRGDIVIDDIDCAYPAYAIMAHDTADYPTEKLLELMQ